MASVFFKSQFLFLYNIPPSKDTTAFKGTKYVNYVKLMPSKPGKFRCGFANMDMKPSTLSEEAADARAWFIINNLKSKNILGFELQVDEIWFHPTSLTEPPPKPLYPNMVRSNFFFIYNIGSGITEQTLQKLCKTENVLIVSGRQNQQSKCVFIDLSDQKSEEEERQIISALLNTTNPPDHEQYFQIDEVWLRNTNDVRPKNARSAAELLNNVSDSIDTSKLYGGMDENLDMMSDEEIRLLITALRIATDSVINSGQKNKGSAKEETRQKILFAQKYYQDRIERNGKDDSKNNAKAAIVPKMHYRNDHDDMSISDQPPPKRAHMGHPIDTLLPFSRMESTPSMVPPPSRVPPSTKLSAGYNRHADLPYKSANSNPAPSQHASMSYMDLYQPAMIDNSFEQSYNSSHQQPYGDSMQASNFLGSHEMYQSKITPDENLNLCRSCFLFIAEYPPDLPPSAVRAAIPELSELIVAKDDDELLGFVMLQNFEDITRERAISALIQQFGLQVDRIWLQPLQEDPASVVPVEPSPAYPVQGPSTSVQRPPDTRITHQSNNRGFNDDTKDSDCLNWNLDSGAPFGLTKSEVLFMKASGNSTPNAAVFYCLEVSNITIPTATLLHFLPPTEDISSKAIFNSVGGRRMLFFGGTYKETQELKNRVERKLTPSICTNLIFTILPCNAPRSLAPIPVELGHRLKSRRLLLTGIPAWPTTIVLRFVAAMMPNVVTSICPGNHNGTSLGYVYVGYKDHTLCDMDYARLSDKKRGTSEPIVIDYVIDSGWNDNGPQGMSGMGPETESEKMSLINLRSSTALDEETKVQSVPSQMEQYRPNLPYPIDFCRLMVKSSHLESFGVFKVYVPADLTPQHVSSFVLKSTPQPSISKIKAFSIMTEHSLTYLFLTFCTSSYQKSISTTTLKYLREMKKIGPCIFAGSSGAMVFNGPVSIEEGSLKNLQFLIIFNFPTSWTEDHHLDVAHKVCPNARSYAVPPDSKGAVFVRFDDPRRCREFIVNSGSCIRVPECSERLWIFYYYFKDDRQILYRGVKYSFPIHNTFDWMRRSTDGSGKWEMDNGFEDIFLCLCHMDDSTVPTNILDDN